MSRSGKFLVKIKHFESKYLIQKVEHLFFATNSLTPHRKFFK